MTFAVLSPILLIALSYLLIFSTTTHAHLAPGMAVVFAGTLVIVAFSLNRHLPLWAGLFAAVGHQAAVEVMVARRLSLGIPYGLFVLHSVVIAVVGVGLWLLTKMSREIFHKALEEQRARQHESALLGAYFTEEVKKKVLTEGVQLACERHVVAVLFADMRGFTGWAEERDASEVVTQHNEYFDEMVSVIKSHGGTVDKFIGDAVLAVFGGVRAVENPSEAALRCAIGMRRALSKLHHDWEDRGLPKLDIGIGIHFGEVVQGPIGSKERKEFTVIGDTVNVAARIESLTKDLKAPILLSSTAQEALNPRLRKRLSRAGEFEVKGKRELVTLFQVEPSTSTDDWQEEKSLPPLPLRAVPVALKT